MADRIGDLAVFVIDGKGQVHWLMPGDVVPEWASGQVGEHALASAVGPAAGGLVTGIWPPGWPTRRPSADTPSDVVKTVAASAPASSGEEPPPQAGAGSSRDHWASYATAHGVTVGADWKRDRIIDTCREGGVRVE